MTDHGTIEGQSAEDFWNNRYRQSDRIWSGKVNAALAGAVEELPPGRALDLGCGEGGDAIWLAGRGWRVTGVDVSATALARTAEHAAEAGVADLVTCRQVDLASDFPEGEFDLVSAQFLQSPIAFPREQVLRRAADAVAPGGLLLIVTHAAPPPWAKHVIDHVDFPSPAETLAALDLPEDAWHADRVATVERPVTGPDGEPAVLLDGVLALRRAGAEADQTGLNPLARS